MNLRTSLLESEEWVSAFTWHMPDSGLKAQTQSSLKGASGSKGREEEMTVMMLEEEKVRQKWCPGDIIK